MAAGGRYSEATSRPRVTRSADAHTGARASEIPVMDAFWAALASGAALALLGEAVKSGLGRWFRVLRPDRVDRCPRCGREHLVRALSTAETAWFSVLVLVSPSRSRRPCCWASPRSSCCSPCCSAGCPPVRRSGWRCGSRSARSSPGPPCGRSRTSAPGRRSAAVTAATAGHDCHRSEGGPVLAGDFATTTSRKGTS